MSIRHSAVSLAGHGLVLTPQLGAQGSEAPAVVVRGVDGLDDPAGYLIDECGGKLFPPVKAVELMSAAASCSRPSKPWSSANFPPKGAEGAGVKSWSDSSRAMV